MTAAAPQPTVTLNRPGRPRKAQAERRTERLPAVRVTLAELAQAQQQAAKAGLDLATFCRTATLQQRIDTGSAARIDALLVQLNRVGVALHRIAMAPARPADLPQDLDQILAELRNVLTRIARGGP